MDSFLVLALSPFLVFALLGLFDTWYHGYRSPLDWWRQRILRRRR